MADRFLSAAVEPTLRSTVEAFEVLFRAKTPANASPALCKNPLREVLVVRSIKKLSGLLKVPLIHMATVFCP